jgi:hypothetical protein
LGVPRKGRGLPRTVARDARLAPPARPRRDIRHGIGGTVKFTLTDEIPFPRETVFRTHRDKLVEIVPYLPNVQSIVVESRVEQGPVVQLVNLWAGTADDVPAVIRPLIKPELLTWIDRATWDESKWRCDWDIQLTALPDAITARGYNLMREEDGETIIQMQGEFTIHPDRVPGVPAFVARAAAPTLERFVVGLLQPNLRKTNEAVKTWLRDHR